MEEVSDSSDWESVGPIWISLPIYGGSDVSFMNSCIQKETKKILKKIKRLFLSTNPLEEEEEEEPISPGYTLLRSLILKIYLLM